MANIFPPVTTHQREIGIMLNMLSSTIVGRSAVYVSAPITSGKRFADWLNTRSIEVDLSHPQTYQEFQREVLEPNCEHARGIIEKLRQKFPVLIDPTALKDIESWTQTDYRYLWARVIEQFADRVVFLDGWQYSNGCCYEFLIASRLLEQKQTSVLKEDLDHLSIEKGLALIRAAITHMHASQLPTEFLERVADELSKVASQEEICAEP